MHTLPINGANFWPLLAKLAIRYSAVLMFVSAMLSCGNNMDAERGTGNANSVADSPDTTGMTTPAPDEAKMISNKLYLLYIMNTPDHPELESLIKKGNAQKQKAVFQFYRNQAGVLGLYAFSGKKKNEEFFDKVEAQKTGDEVESVYNRKVVLGSVQFDNDIVKALEDHIVSPGGRDDPDYRYIWFKPAFLNKDGLDYVVYEVSASSSLDEKPLGQKALTRIGTANPSPPYGAY